MLGTAQSFRLLRAKRRCNGTVRPSEPSLRGFVDRPEPWRRDRQDAAFSLDQDIAGIGGSCGDKRDPAGLARCHLTAYPLSQGAGLAKTAAGKQQPDLPI